MIAKKDDADPEDIRKATSELQQSSLKLFEMAYKKVIEYLNVTLSVVFCGFCVSCFSIVDFQLRCISFMCRWQLNVKVRQVVVAVRVVTVVLRKKKKERKRRIKITFE